MTHFIVSLVDGFGFDYDEATYCRITNPENLKHQVSSLLFFAISLTVEKERKHHDERLWRVY